MGFFKFPYTNFHELNLDWVVKAIKDVENEIVKTNNGVMDFEKKVEKILAGFEEYIKTLDVPAEVDKVLQKMIEDGTLENMIRDLVEGSVFKDFNNRLDNVEKKTENIPFIPTNDDVVDFRNDSLRCAASYLVHAVGADSVVPGDGGLENIDTPFAPVYSDGTKTYAAGLGQSVSGFVTTDKKSIDGVEYPVAYFDCTSFLTLLTKCRYYGDDVSNEKNESPYHYAFKYGVSGDDVNVVNRMLEAGSSSSKPYVFDFQNYVYSARMAYMMDMCGNKLKHVSHRDSTDSDPVFFEDEVKNLETSYILFMGRASASGYKGIVHGLYYIKTLEEINVFGERYNATFRAVGTGAHPEYGYIIHVSTATNPNNDYNNVIRIMTLYDICKEGNYTDCYACKPYSNVLISNKARRNCDMYMTTYNDVRVCSRYTDGNSIPADYGWDINGDFRFRNASVIGNELAANSDANKIDNGFWKVTTGSNVGTIANIPAWFTAGPWAFNLIQICRTDPTKDSMRYGIQFISPLSSTSAGPKMYFRTCSYGNVWSKWMLITATEEA